MFSRKPRSISLCCWMCAILGTFLCWLLLSFNTISRAEDPSTTKPPIGKTRKAPRYERQKKHDPNGIGKFYMGREIAHVMGYPAADWLDRDNREEEERLSLLVKSLGLKPGMMVADIGAGSGRISVMMAKEIQETGNVFAVDIQQEMLELIAEKMVLQEVKNIKLVKGDEKSPNLEADSIDLALMVDVYHEFEYPYEMILSLSKAIKTGGRVVLVEYRKEDVDVPIKRVHKMTEAQAKRELVQPEFRFQWKETIGVLPWQHIIVFEKQPPSEE